MAVPPLAPLKPRLRTITRGGRTAFRAALVADGGLAAAEAAIGSRLLTEAGGFALIALHLPYGDEPAFVGLAEMLVLSGKRLALPALAAGDHVRFAAWLPGKSLCPGPMGIRQPDGDAATVTPDLIVAPLIAFDREGGRLGQGGGHYDRLSSQCPRAVRIGCAWSVQEIAAVPQDPWDMPLHTVVTERESIRCGGRP